MKKLSLKLTVWPLMVIVYLLTGNARANSLSIPGNREVSNQTLTTNTESVAFCKAKAETECQKEYRSAGGESESTDYFQCVEEKQKACDKNEGIHIDFKKLYCSFFGEQLCEKKHEECLQNKDEHSCSLELSLCQTNVYLSCIDPASPEWNPNSN